MKVLPKKIQKGDALTIHMTGTERRYLGIRKRETGLPMNEIIRAEYLTKTAERYFKRLKRTSKNGHKAASDIAPVQEHE